MQRGKHLRISSPTTSFDSDKSTASSAPEGSNSPTTSAEAIAGDGIDNDEEAGDRTLHKVNKEVDGSQADNISEELVAIPRTYQDLSQGRAIDPERRLEWTIDVNGYRQLQRLIEQRSPPNQAGKTWAIDNAREEHDPHQGLLRLCMPCTLHDEFAQVNAMIPKAG